MEKIGGFVQVLSTTIKKTPSIAQSYMPVMRLLLAFSTLSLPNRCLSMCINIDNLAMAMALFAWELATKNRSDANRILMY